MILAWLEIGGLCGLLLFVLVVGLAYLWDSYRDLM